jgi:hypothetical protein
MDTLKKTHRRLSALVDAGHGRNHPELYIILERIESLIIVATGDYLIPEHERRTKYGTA